jgi:protein tyrosine phosphatase (PTP) superfamily phosphohydrolase (DUF442 family)
MKLRLPDVRDLRGPRCSVSPVSPHAEVGSRPFVAPYWVVPGRLCGSSMPSCIRDVVFLRERGVELVVTLMEEHEADILSVHRNCMDCGIRVLHIPVPEFETPTMRDVEYVISEVKDAGGAVCIHCSRGWGRTGVLLCCCLMDLLKLSPEAALSHVRSLEPNAASSSKQESFVFEFAKQMEK